MKAHELLNTEDKWCSHELHGCDDDGKNSVVGAILTCYSPPESIVVIDKLIDYLIPDHPGKHPFLTLYHINEWEHYTSYKTIYNTLKELDI